MARLEIRHQLNIDSPPENVFNQISTIEGLKHWWTPLTSGSEEINGELKLQFGPDYFKLLKVCESKPPFWLVWECRFGSKEWVGTKISFELEAIYKGTKLSFCHSGWSFSTDMFAQCSYDWALFLRSLKKLCEVGEGHPYPLHVLV